jgi:alpha-L-fucosidase
MTIGGLRFKVQSARFLATGAPVRFMQRGSQLIFLDLPAKVPDDPVTVIAVECDSEPIQHALSSKADAAS